MINGYIKFNDKSYVFWFNEPILEIIPEHKHQKDIIELLDELFKNPQENKTPETIDGTISNSNCKIIFYIKEALIRDGNNYKFSVWSYIQYSSIEAEVSKITFSSPELNWFINLGDAYKFSFNINNGEMYLSVDSHDNILKSWNFNFDKKLIKTTLGVNRSYSHAGTTPISLNPEISFEFEPTEERDTYFDLYDVFKSFINFIAYRQNTAIWSVILKNKDIDDGKYRKVGELYICNSRKQLGEKEKIARERLIKYNQIDNSIGNIFQLLSDNKVYKEHIPMSNQDMRRINIARFILITAAFEWEYNCLFRIKKADINDEFREIRQSLLGLAAGLIDDSKGKKKKYAKSYKNIIRKIDFSLSEKIANSFNEFDSILEIFISKLYVINHLDKPNYTTIAKRIENQRNNYAHGNIDKQLEPMVILDIICLEWIIYSMVLRRARMSDVAIRDTINELFGRKMSFD